MTATLEASLEIPLIDHHCHGLLQGDLDRDSYELLATESDWAQPPGQTIFDSPFGVTVRAECAPELGLERHCTDTDYWAARSRLGQRATAELLMPRTGIDTFIIDTGFRSTAILSPQETAKLAAATESYEIVRLESTAEAIASRTTADTFADDFRDELTRRQASAIGFKSIMAYRHGLDFDASPPDSDSVRKAAAEWLDRTDPANPRLDHPVLLRHVLWTAVTYAKPIQFHVGYGDSDIDLHRCDPTQMTDFIRRTVDTGAQIMLLHCYPFIREAGFLAQVYPHVWLDTGAAVNYTGPSSTTLIRHALELAPFAKVLFSSDAFGLPELYYCGALLWRRGLAEVLDDWIGRDQISQTDALRYVEMMGRTNAQRAYRLGSA